MYKASQNADFGKEGKSFTNSTILPKHSFRPYNELLLNADWLRQMAFFINFGTCQDKLLSLFSCSNIL